jgi:hypothetical protein
MSLTKAFAFRGLLSVILCATMNDTEMWPFCIIQQPETLMIQLVKKIIFNKYLWLLFLPLLVIWLLLMLRVQQRTDFAMFRQMESVKRIWGGNLEQPMPSIRYKGLGSDVSTLNRGEITASDISVSLEMDYRKKGLVYYTGYNASFAGKYTIQNPEDEKIYLSFIFPYPTQQGEGILRNVKLFVNGEEDGENTEYQQNLLLWTGLLESTETLEMTVQYEGRGLHHFMYGFEPGTQINSFTMTMDVLGAKNVDYPISTMTPTRTQSTANGMNMVWELDRSLTEFNIGVILPDKLNVAQQIAVMSRRAPVFFLIFLASVCVILRLCDYPLHFFKIAMLSVAYFFFYPLFAYLSVYMNIVLSFALSFGILRALIFNYARILYRLNVAVAIVLAYAFYLGITSIAALFPTHTGLILVIEGVILLAIVMQALSRYQDVKWLELFGITTPRPPKPPKKQAAASNDDRPSPDIPDTDKGNVSTE